MRHVAEWLSGRTFPELQSVIAEHGHTINELIAIAAAIDAAMQFSTPADTETALIISRNVSGTLSFQRVSMGAANSAGAGFKTLRVPN